LRVGEGSLIPPCLQSFALPDKTMSANQLPAILRETSEETSYSMVRLVFAPIPKSEDRFARQNLFCPPTEFPLSLACSGIVHHLSGPNGYTCTHILTFKVLSGWCCNPMKEDITPENLLSFSIIVSLTILLA